MAKSIAISDCKDLSRLYTGRKQHRRLADSPLRPVHAIDCETDSNGDLFLIADSQGHYLDKNIDADSVIDFLFRREYEGSWNFAWNLSFDGSVILKLLGKELLQYTKTCRLNFRHGEYRIAYIPGKCLRIMKGHHSVVIYDIAQFYNKQQLVKAYQSNIGQLDKTYLEFKSQRSIFSKRFYRRNTSAVRDYCIKDCKMTKALAENWIKIFHDAFGFYPARWFSAGYLAEKVLVNNGISFPTFDSIPYEVQDLAFKSYFGGRFEIHKRGFIGQAYLYDINSAYPAAIASLPNLTDGRWITASKIHPKARIGFFEITADMPDVKPVPPFPFRKNGIVVFPSGRFRTFVTLDELKACENPEYYRIVRSWQFVPNSNYQPYAHFIESLYEKRLLLKERKDPMQLPVKIILNSFYGKAGQKVNRVIGNLFNPVIFAYITGFTRAKLYRFVIDNDLESKVVSFATDSVCITKDLGLKSNRLGDFSLDKSSNDVYYLQNGIYRFNGVWKQRGLGNLKGRTLEHIDTIEKDGRLYLVLKPTRSASLRECIIQGRIQDIGKIRPIRRLVNLNADRKRFWLGTLKSINGKVCNESLPISLSHFGKDEI